MTGCVDDDDKTKRENLRKNNFHSAENRVLKYDRHRDGDRVGRWVYLFDVHYDRDVKRSRFRATVGPIIVKITTDNNQTNRSSSIPRGSDDIIA